MDTALTKSFTQGKKSKDKIYNPSLLSRCKLHCAADAPLKVYNNLQSLFLKLFQGEKIVSQVELQPLHLTVETF